MVQSLDHSIWNNLLTKYVTPNGNVDYKKFKNEAKVLDNYLEILAKNSPEASWDKNERLAYYINLYNAATVKLILDNYPVKSIKDLKSPWDRKWVRSGSETLSLGQIEHKILRKMKEPRIHFAINCASFSCPKLLNEAFVPSRLETQLQQATIDFINDPKRNIISEDRLQLSNIFKWYRKDFTDNISLEEYINTFTDKSIATDAKIEFLKYNWSLNDTE
ncbi:MAG: DUF547 domain-containing protein [Eudoraea sp.]|nr:DUF547 domain-containing protein [Eudoraea sp.]